MGEKTKTISLYENPSNGFLRGTSTRRDDSGNGACETLYVEEFEIIAKANPGWRGLATFTRWGLGLSLLLLLLLFLFLFFVTPVRSPFGN